MDIIGDLRLDFTSEEGILELQRNIKSWFEHFLKVYQAKDVTPYMHALCYHVPEFLSLYQNIAYYTQQGLEKYNNRASKDFFRSTNHKGVDALKQLFLKKNRIQFLEAAGYERVKNTYNDELVFNDWTSLSQPILNSSWNYIGKIFTYI